MDAAILRTLLEKLTGLDESLQVQTSLEEARVAIANLASNPADASFQAAFSAAFKKLKGAYATLGESITPGEWDRLREINSAVDFDSTNIERIENLIAENGASPAVVRDAIVEISEKRSEEMNRYVNLANALEYYGFEDATNGVDRAQIGFKIPRDLFDNDFSSLISELNFIRKMVRVVAESEGADPDDIDVGAISTTDPIFWLIVGYVVASSIGKLTDWALGTWKSVEEIKNIRAQTANLKSFNESEVEKIFGPKIEQEISKSISQKVTEITKGLKDPGRKNELKNGLSITLRQFLARVERGLTVDIRYLPPPIETTDGEASEDSRVSARRNEMEQLATRLDFKKPEGDPILMLEAANDDVKSDQTSQS